MDPVEQTAGRLELRENRLAGPTVQTEWIKPGSYCVILGRPGQKMTNRSENGKKKN